MELSLKGMKQFVRSLSKMTAVLIGDKEEGKERSYGIPPQVGWSQIPGHLGRAALGAGGADVQETEAFHFVHKFA